MRKFIKLVIVGIILLTSLNVLLFVNGSEKEEGNTLTLNAQISENCIEHVELAGKQYYSMAGAEYAVKNSNGEIVGIFVTDEDGQGFVKDTNDIALTNLSDGEYLIELIKQPYNNAVICDIGFDDKKYISLQSHTPKPTVIGINTATDLYAKNNGGNYFSNNQYKLWSSDYGTGIFECGIAEVDSPCEISSFGYHQLDVSDADILDRDGKTDAGYTNELIYKIMYYGRSGPNQWSGFSNGKYYNPFMSRNGKNQYTAGYSSNEGLAAFITHVALSRAWGRDKGKWALQAPVSGFYDFWNYVMSAEKAPSNFVVYVWQHSQIHKNEQDMFFGYTLEKTDYDNQNVVMNLVTDYDPINVILRKSSTDGQRVAGAQFKVKYYNEYLENIAAAEGKKPIREWIFETNNRGMVWYDESYQVGGDKIFYSSRSKSCVMLPGTYVISETLIPEGYVKADDFMIRSDDYNDKNLRLYAADGITELGRYQECGYELVEYKEGYLNLIKKSVDIYNKITLEEAIYNVYLDKNCTEQAKINNSSDYAILKTNSDGMSNTVALAPGKYYIKEIAAPLGYFIDENIYEVEIAENETIQKEVFDKQIRCEVIKKDNEGNNIEGAIIELYKDNELLTSFVSKKEPTDISCFLKQNVTYHLHEKSSPEGYLCCDDVYFLIDSNVKELVTISMIDAYQPTIETKAYFLDGKKITKEGGVTIFDEVLLGNLIVGNKYLLKGYVYDKNNPDICLRENSKEFSADDSSQNVNMQFDINAEKNKKYVVFERLYDEKGILLSEHCDLNDLSQTVYCAGIIKLKVIKRDEKDIEKLLPDCEITVYNQNGEIAKDINGEIAVKVTDDSGKVEFELFDLEEEYYVQETKAPSGYRINKKKFYVDSANAEIIIEIDDAKVSNTGDININIVMAIAVLSLSFLVIVICKKEILKRVK